jgi:hypothetical protein
MHSGEVGAGTGGSTSASGGGSVQESKEVSTVVALSYRTASFWVMCCAATVSVLADHRN